mgnify:CR=1 FL=1
MAKISTKELLEIAQDESTTPEQLNKIWNTSRSIKVRKAVASNPNAGSLTLRLAARLYIEEVLDNPGFQMLNLFDDDEWIKRIGEVYEDPETWSKSYYYARRVDQMEPFARAALLSDNLNQIHLNSIMEFLPVTSLKRAFKYEKTKIKVRSFFTNGGFSLETIFKAYGSGLIDEVQLYQSLKTISYVGSLSCRKSVYVRTIKILLSQFDNRPDAVGRAISMILLSSRVSCINWVDRLFEHKHLYAVSRAILAAKKIKKRRGSGVSQATRSTIQALSSIVSGVLWGQLNYEEKRTGLSSFYKSVCQLGLENHQWGDSKQTWNSVIITQEICEELLKEDIRVKAFYVKSLCLGTWFHVQKSSVKFQIVEEVNDWLYDQGGFDNILYKDISLKKLIALTDDVYIGY